MKVYFIEDVYGCTSTHLATNFDAAVQAHLVHYSLFQIEEVWSVKVKELSTIKDRNLICWNSGCCLAAASDPNESK